MSETDQKTTSTCKHKGAPAFRVSVELRNEVIEMAAAGLTHRQMCAKIVNPETGKQIDMSTFRKYFLDDVHRGRGKSCVPVHHMIYQKALDGDKWCAKFWIDRFDAMEEAEKKDLEHLLETNDSFKELVDTIVTRKIAHNMRSHEEHEQFYKPGLDEDE